ncbi:glycosyltransferase family 1 protein [Roseovarius sp. A46]|uniref:glycosyltransferase family 4 protein n=1 Tax=Roseovarius sp. A46 TaxID=2109331 RepID=UPI001010A7AD|nr:glycosyltransferase family 1 protein [Roseovarius sp. A46]RXV59036.1 glycosyltransferase family 1 protein [Roseovarius sp. A46]
MTRIVYDLTEVFLASTGRFPYYGIVRVVEEIGRELYRLDPDLRFAIFSHAYNKFYEVFPSLEREDDRVDLNVPQNVRQIHHLRRRHYTKHVVRDALLPIAHGLITAINRRRWRQAGLQMSEIDMNDTLLISTGRPKHMVAALDALDTDGVSYRFIPLLHDMFPLHEFTPDAPKAFPLNFIGDNRLVISRAEKIIAISEFTKSDIESYSRDGLLPPTPEIVTVPLVQQCKTSGEPAVQALPQKPYILTVGATVGRKNLEVVLDALLMMQEHGDEVPDLVLAGAPRKHVEKFLARERFDPIRTNVQKVCNPNQTDLVRLYENAIALILPSRIEGWGLPAGEALWTGTPAICSTAPVLREVCGDLGLYFDPNKPEELVAHIERLMHDEAFAQDLRQRIAAARPRLRTWATVARDVRRVYTAEPALVAAK